MCVCVFIIISSICRLMSQDCFYSVPSPGTMALFCRDLVFNDHKAYVMALADALAEEYQLIAQHGLLLQVNIRQT